MQRGQVSGRPGTGIPGIRSGGEKRTGKVFKKEKESETTKERHYKKEICLMTRLGQGKVEQEAKPQIRIERPHVWRRSQLPQ
jgi:hypothetical protein